MPEHFKVGTHNYPVLSSLVTGVSFTISRGLDAITAKADRQTSFLIKELKKEPGITIYNDHPLLPIVTFNIPAWRMMMWGSSWRVPIILLPGPGFTELPLCTKLLEKGRTVFILVSPGLHR